jgi:hypothetical protein
MQLYKFVVPDDETALLAYADSQWPKNRLWVDSASPASCLMVSNTNKTNFEKVPTPCLTNFEYFYCEYKSKIKLPFSRSINQFNLLTVPTPDLNAISEPVERKIKVNFNLMMTKHRKYF